MIHRLTHGSITWIDLEDPTENEVREIAKEFGVHKLVADELLTPSERAKVDPYDKYTYLIFHFPFCDTNTHTCQEQEMDFIVGKKFIITTHYESIPALEEFKESFDQLLGGHKRKITHSGFIFYHILLGLYVKLKKDLRLIGYRLGEIEDQIFLGNERQMVHELSLVSRVIIDFRRAVRHHENIIESFGVIALEFFNNKFNYYIDDLMGEYRKVANFLSANRETLAELRETNDSLVSTKMNEIMKNLTIMAFVTFPLSLLAAIFGMNTVHIPLLGHPYDFWLVIGIMFVGATYMYGYFKYKQWI